MASDKALNNILDQLMHYTHREQYGKITALANKMTQAQAKEIGENYDGDYFALTSLSEINTPAAKNAFKALANKVGPYMRPGEVSDVINFAAGNDNYDAVIAIANKMTQAQAKEIGKNYDSDYFALTWLSERNTPAAKNAFKALANKVGPHMRPEEVSQIIEATYENSAYDLLTFIAKKLTVSQAQFIGKRTDTDEIVLIELAQDIADGKNADSAFKALAQKVAPYMQNMEVESVVNALHEEGLAQYQSIFPGHSDQANIINGNNRNNTIRAKSDDDIIDGKNGNDKLYGNKGDDTLYGGNGNDQLYGGSGNDILNGGHGKDTLKGGGGKDTYVFDNIGARDTVIGFNKNQDKLDLSDLLEKYHPGQDDIDGFISMTKSGKDTMLWVDTNGKAAGKDFDQIALLKGVSIKESEIENLVDNGTIII